MATEKRLIDANALKQRLDEREAEDVEMYGCRIIECFPADDAKEIVDQMPTVDAVEVVHGEWIRGLDEYDVEFIECPLCGGEFYDGDNDTFDKPYNYCPNCGAKMEGDGNG